MNNESLSAAELPQLPEYRHVLRTKGVVVTLTLDEDTGAVDLEWSECPTRELMDLVADEYYPWRDEILRAWEQRTGRQYFACFQSP
jgi:hypothetical protein